MSNNQSSLSCTIWCFGLAGLIALLAAVLLMLIGDWRLIQALFAAIVIGIILGALLSWIVCRPLPGANENHMRVKEDTHPVPTSKQSAAAAAEAAKAGAEPEAAPVAAASPAAAVGAASVTAAATAAKAGVKPSAALSGEAELAERKGEWKYEAPAKPAAKKPAAKKTTAKKADAKKPAAKKKAAPKKAASKAADQVDYDGDGVLEGKDEGTRPAALDGPRGGKADDLKQIKGIGPKLEKLCNSLGFYHFDQVAAWTRDEVAWVDANLEGFKGRVTRDTWVEQAKILAAGGDTEFSKRVEDGDVY